MVLEDQKSCIPCSGIGAYLSKTDDSSTTDICLGGENTIIKDGDITKNHYICEDDFVEWEFFDRCRPACSGIMNMFDQYTGACICKYRFTHEEIRKADGSIVDTESDDTVTGCYCNAGYSRRNDNDVNELEGPCSTI